MMLQNIIIALIGLGLFAYIARKVYLLFYPKRGKGEGQSPCQGCAGGCCPTPQKQQKPNQQSTKKP